MLKINDISTYIVVKWLPTVTICIFICKFSTKNKHSETLSIMVQVRKAISTCYHDICLQLSLKESKTVIYLCLPTFTVNNDKTLNSLVRLNTFQRIFNFRLQNHTKKLSYHKDDRTMWNKCQIYSLSIATLSFKIRSNFFSLQQWNSETS